MQAPIKDMAYDDERDVLYVLHENNDIAARIAPESRFLLPRAPPPLSHALARVAPCALGSRQRALRRAALRTA
jgi:hypothetical protein